MIWARRLTPPALLFSVVMAMPARAESPIGRLFFSPAERADMDARRTDPARQTSAPSTPPSAAEPAGASGQIGAAGQPVDDEQDTPGRPPPPMPDTRNAAATADPAPTARAETLELNGILRSSSGRSTVWLNEVAQQGGRDNVRVAGKGVPAATVTLPSGQKVILRTGQRYDAAQHQIKDINEP